MKLFILTFFIVISLPILCMAESSDRAIQNFFRTISLERKLNESFNEVLLSISSKKLKEIAASGGVANSVQTDDIDMSPLIKLNSVGEIGRKKFSARKLMREVHEPYYKRNYSDDELKVVGNFMKRLAPRMKSKNMSDRTKAALREFAMSSAGKKYLSLENQEIDLAKVSFSRMEKIATQSVKEAFND